MVVRPPLSVTVAGLLAVCVACAAAPGDPPIKVASSAAGEEVAVYAALLSERFVGPDTGRLVVSAQPSAQFLPDDLPYDLWPELDRAQGVATPIVSSIPSTVPVVLLNEAEVSALKLAADYEWSPFFRAYPDAEGLIELSAVGFDSQRQRALVCAVLVCGGRCGHGGLYALEKADGRWYVAEQVGWIAI